MSLISLTRWPIHPGCSCFLCVRPLVCACRLLCSMTVAVVALARMSAESSLNIRLSIAVRATDYDLIGDNSKTAPAHQRTASIAALSANKFVCSAIPRITSRTLISLLLTFKLMNNLSGFVHLQGRWLTGLLGGYQTLARCRLSVSALPGHTLQHAVHCSNLLNATIWFTAVAIWSVSCLLLNCKYIVTQYPFSRPRDACF